MTTTEQPKPPLKQLADIMSEHRALHEMKEAYDDTESDYEELDRDLASRAFTLINTQGLKDLSNPLVAEAHRFVKRYETEQADLRASYPTDREIATTYQEGGLYKNLSDRSRELVDTLMLDLLDEETLSDVGTVVRTPQEAADALGLREADVEKAYGLLSEIEEPLNEGDIIEFLAIAFDKSETIPGMDSDESDESEGGKSTGNGGSYVLSDRYMARVRKSDSAQIISLVMDAVPPAENNAAYILRNDDGALEDVVSAVATKQKARAHGARRVHHNGITGQAGTLKRINTLLSIPLETFRDPSYRPR